MCIKYRVAVLRAAGKTKGAGTGVGPRVGRRDSERINVILHKACSPWPMSAMAYLMNGTHSGCDVRGGVGVGLEDRGREAGQAEVGRHKEGIEGLNEGMLRADGRTGQIEGNSRAFGTAEAK